MTKEQFYQQKLGRPWKSDPKLCFALGLVGEYLETCDQYDNAVCPMRFEGVVAQPETTRQWNLITQYAKVKREELLGEFSMMFEISRATAEAYWDKAMRMGGAIGDD